MKKEPPPPRRSAFRVSGSSEFRPWFLPSALLAAGLALPTALEAQPYPYRDDWARHFRIGLLVAFNIKAEFSLSGTIPTASGDPGPPGVPGVDHLYDDGYVRVDDTGNAGGVTSFWGYDNASQYDPTTGQLVFHNTRGFTTQDNTESASGVNFGFELAYGGRIHDWRRVRLGWEFGYGILPLDLEDHRQEPATFERVVQAFNTGGITLPAAPYQGGPSGIGPVIPDLAYERPSEIVAGTITGTRSIDATLHAFRLGPTVFWRFLPQFAFSGSVGPALGFVNGGYRFNETFVFADGTTAHNSGDDNDPEVVFGGYAAATLLYRVMDTADLYFTAQFMSLGDVDYQSGGRRAELKLGTTVTVSVGVSWPF